ncbi:MAG: N,N'-diacetyllegionaminic acid synthase [Alphaproteobacteria bacterium MarineAlpha4_Bin2]|mgnify:CR=1 FL=1|nr:MAG: N,N'-diacetyllegionaminic acid synthase [Alphaproteobacteria bacterium MarineAlpha4_Bin2]
MSDYVDIRGHKIGYRTPVYFIAEIGINHNGSLSIAKSLIDAAVAAGCDAVKFQKRTVEVVYSEEELNRPRESIFGQTNGELKYGLEFNRDAFIEINDYCQRKNIDWFSSCWDEASIDFMEFFDPPVYKIASACLTDDNLLHYHRGTGKPIILSTGMSSIEQIDHAVDILGKESLILLHCTSTYPTAVDELNLRVIQSLRDRFEVPVGYSGHETGLATTIAAAALGATVIERHITLDRSMWGSDQAASIEPHGLNRLVRDIRSIQIGLGDGNKVVYDSEFQIIEKLRRIDTQSHSHFYGVRKN